MHMLYYTNYTHLQTIYKYINTNMKMSAQYKKNWKIYRVGPMMKLSWVAELRRVLGDRAILQRNIIHSTDKKYVKEFMKPNMSIHGH